MTTEGHIELLTKHTNIMKNHEIINGKIHIGRELSNDSFGKNYEMLFFDRDICKTTGDTDIAVYNDIFFDIIQTYNVHLVKTLKGIEERRGFIISANYPLKFPNDINTYMKKYSAKQEETHKLENGEKYYLSVNIG